MNPKYLKSAVFGASDGVITTFAVVAGVAGAGFSTDIIVVLGVSNMVADGLSMSIGDFLGERSEQQLRKQQTGSKTFNEAWKLGLVTFLAFNIAGFMPLIPYVLAPALKINIPSTTQLPLAAISTAVALFVVGSLRSLLLKTSWIKNGLEVLGVGSIAAACAYLLGAIIERNLLN